MTTAWAWRVTATARPDLLNEPAAIGTLFADNHSGESASDEAKYIERALTITSSGTVPPMIVLLDTPVTAAILDALKGEIGGIAYGGARYVVRNALTGQILETNFAALEAQIGEVVATSTLINSLSAQTLEYAFAAQDGETSNVLVTTTERYPGGVVVCLDDVDDPQNWISAYAINNGTTFSAYLKKCVGGTITHIATLAAPHKAGASMSLEYADSIVRVFYGGVQVGIDYRISEAVFATQMQHGIIKGRDTDALDGTTVEAAVPFNLDNSTSAIFTVTTPAANLWAGTAPLDWIGTPGLCDLGTHWIAGYQERQGHGVGGEGSGWRIRFSDDEGATWTAVGKFLDGADVTGLPAGVGTCYFLNAPNGDVLFFRQFADILYRSSDGGKSWTSAASGIPDPALRMQAGYGFTLDGVIYVPMHKFASQPGNAKPWDQEVWVSDDDGATWELRGTVPYAPGTSGNEVSIINTGGTNLVAVCRDTGKETTYYNTSADLGATWSARQEIVGMGIMQMMRMRHYAGGIIGFGREGEKAQGAVFTTIWYSTDGVTWGRKFRPDTQGFGDAAYCDVLQRTDGKFYLMTYGGSDAAAAIRSAVFEIV